MEFEDRRGQLLRILPRDLRRDLLRRLNDFGNLGALKEWIRQQLELEKNWNETDNANSRSRAVAVVEADQIELGEEEPEENDMEALLALTQDSSLEEIRAVQQRFKRFAGRAGRAARPAGRAGAAQGRGSPQPRAGGGGPKPGPARLPGDSGSTKCINCGKTGHSTQKCPEGPKTATMLPVWENGAHEGELPAAQQASQCDD